MICAPAIREKLEPVRALLHQLQELRNVTIVVATTRLGLGFDLEKLARFIEVLPSPSRVRVLQQLQKVRSAAMTSFELGGLVDPIPPGRRLKLSLPPYFFLPLPSKPLQSMDALVALSPTPRTLKQGLRDFLHTWRKNLCGEVDVDHALGAFILRHSEPEIIFQILVSRTDALRSRRHNDDWWRRGQKELPSDCEMFLRELGVRADIPELLSPQDRDSLRKTFVKAFLGTFDDNPDTLAKALKGAEPWLLHRLCYGFEESRYAAKEVPFAEWPSFANTLASAARSCAEQMLPQLAHFLTQCVLEQGLRYKATVDHDAISRRFPDDNILSLFAQHPEVTSAHPETQARLVALQTAVEAPEPAAANSG